MTGNKDDHGILENVGGHHIFEHVEHSSDVGNHDLHELGISVQATLPVTVGELGDAQIQMVLRVPIRIHFNGGHVLRRIVTDSAPHALREIVNEGMGRQLVLKQSFAVTLCPGLISCQ